MGINRIQEEDKDIPTIEIETFACCSLAAILRDVGAAQSSSEAYGLIDGGVVEVGGRGVQYGNTVFSPGEEFVLCVTPGRRIENSRTYWVKLVRPR